MTELPKSIRIALGASSAGISDRRLAPAVAGKVILVTGASAGVGRAASLRLARNGAIVLAVARRAANLEQLRDEAAATAGVVHPYPADLTDIDACAELVDRILHDHGHVDVLVNNAGKSIRRWLTDSVDRFDNFEQTTLLNYLAPIRLIMSLLPSMRERGQGHIVNVSTAGVHAPPPEWTAYVSTKLAFLAWMRGAGPELRADGIASTDIHLQLVRTDMLGRGTRMFRYIPGNSAEEAADTVCRAIARRPFAIRPWWERAGAPLLYVADGTGIAKRALTLYVKLANPASRPGGSIGTAITRTEHAANLLDDAVTALSIVPKTGIRHQLPLTRLPQTLGSLRGGASLATILASFAARFPDRPAIIDDFGEVTAGELNRRVERLASAMRDRWGIDRNSTVGVLTRNHRGFVEAIYAASRLSANVVPLNYGFAGPQIGTVLRREKVDLLCYDAEFQAEIERAGFDGLRMIVHDDAALTRDAAELPSVDELIAEGGKRIRRPAYGSSIVILTAGTSGIPKGAPRHLGLGELAPMAKSLHPRMLLAVSDAARIAPALPRVGNPIIVAQPLHHAYGFFATLAAIALGVPAVMHHKFDAEQVLADIEGHRASIACLVPTMLKRIMDLPPEVREKYDHSSLQLVACGAAPMPPHIATAFMDEFGEVLINGYASSEMGLGSLATSADLRAAPGTVGYPPKGLVDIKIVDEDGRELPAGTPGRIINKNPLNFQGYTGGTTKEYLNGYLDTGDLGHFDEAGRLFIDGRSDDMIVCGGEKMFPQEVEELLLSHDAVADAAGIGVADEEFGRRLAVFVVLKAGAKASPAKLKAFVKANLANYKVPRDVYFVESIPRSTGGKIRRQELPGLIEPAAAEPDRASNGHTPATAINA